MGAMEIEIEDCPLAGGREACLVRVGGSVDSATVGELDDALAGLLEGEQRLAIIDLSGTSYVNSRGMSILIKYNDALKAGGGSFILAAVPKPIESTFDAMGLLRTFSVEPDVESAVASLGGPPEPEAVASGPFPLSFICDSCVATLVADGPGKYRCPRCQSCFEVASQGEVTSFPVRTAQSVELNFPCSPAYVDVARAAAGSVAKTLEIASFSTDALDRAVDEAIGLFAAKAGDGQSRVRMFIAADSREFKIAFLSTDPALALGEEDEEGLAFRSLRGIVDELEVQQLSPEGQILTLVKRFDY